MLNLSQTNDPDEFRLFLTQLFSETRFVKVLVTAKREVGLQGGGAGEYVYSLPPLTLRNSVRLFARLCPHVHTGADRRELVRNLVEDDDQGKLIISDGQINERTYTIFHLLGEGYPIRILEAAYSISIEDYRGLFFTLGAEDERNLFDENGGEEVIALESPEPDFVEGEIGIGGLPIITGGMAFEDSDSDSDF